MIIGSLKKKSDMRSIILVLILLGGLIYHGSCLAQLDKVKTIEGQTYQLQFSDSARTDRSALDHYFRQRRAHRRDGV